MKAVVYDEYGSPDVLSVQNVATPVPSDDEVLVKVRAVSLNSSDCEFLSGIPRYVRIWGPRRPPTRILGSDIAGHVDAVGKRVGRFNVGDAVYGDVFGRWGGLAEFVCAPEDKLLHLPEGLTFEDAAAVPQAGVVALQGLRYGGEIRGGDKVLINGAGGGSGTFAIQLAKHFGAARVTAVDHTRKLDFMRSLGADEVVDYTREDFTKRGERYDRILDFVASRSIFACRRSLEPGGRYAMVGGSVPRILQTAVWGPLLSLPRRKKLGLLMHRQNRQDIAFVAGLGESADVKPIIDACYPLSETADAFRRLCEGRALGKVVVTVA